MGLFSHCRPMDVELGVGVDKDIALIILIDSILWTQKYKHESSLG